MPATDSITQARLKELLEYDPDTGLFTRLTNQSSNARIGDVAGRKRPDGYIEIKIDGVPHLAHRLAFLYMLGWIPVEVDHDDQVRHNNRWKNLNAANHHKNMKNMSLRCDNTSGTCGVVYDKQREKWKTQTEVDGKRIFLGRFTHKADAIAARQAADIQYGFHENHGGT